MMRVLPVLLLALLSACAQQPPKDDSLYRDLGAMPGITRIVEGMLLNIARDDRIVERFRRIDIQRLRNKLIEQFCVEAGGPCTYTGDSMAESHKGQNVSRSDFNALVEDLIKAMDSEGIPVPTQNRLLARLAPMRGEVIEH
ncbi:group 1 truncated hemoglobin [Pseudomonas rhodesiae]|uniref:Group 1 truncated hemoglobin n=2 Tax=Pseudomonas TaxID=286 RepID=A0ABY6QPF8_9PSED|nr:MULTISPECIES: group 1 truncated hemoglobin [Pseudomonas]MCX4066043.1 group 1 truncated hemoglobin [Pseudomonas quebecensis]UZW21366.1 group 1 truncated hemoglobin [Pseudomonas quebecensis]UZW26353.1 group 1 truncated hemoglobin [Pseudomonas quebecensis]UZW31413.1 group 1 truncated hemoglobin [Pseudomonas quebecensis]WLH43458.1 group 1 truncated hemoglobin [Pseudomonas sp. FP2254]